MFLAVYGHVQTDISPPKTTSPFQAKNNSPGKPDPGGILFHSYVIWATGQFQKVPVVGHRFLHCILCDTLRTGLRGVAEHRTVASPPSPTGGHHMIDGWPKQRIVTITLIEIGGDRTRTAFSTSARATCVQRKQKKTVERNRLRRIHDKCSIWGMEPLIHEEAQRSEKRSTSKKKKGGEGGGQCATFTPAKGHGMRPFVEPRYLNQHSGNGGNRLVHGLISPRHTFLPMVQARPRH